MNETTRQYRKKLRRKMTEDREKYATPRRRKLLADAIFLAAYYRWLASTRSALGTGNDPITGAPRNARRVVDTFDVDRREGRAVHVALARFWIARAAEIRSPCIYPFPIV